MKVTWVILALAVATSLANSAPAFAPAPLPRRQPREPADPIEAGFARILAAIRAGRDERVTFTIPVGKLWKTPLFPKELCGLGFSTTSRRGVRFTGSNRGRGPCEVTGLGEGTATLLFEFRGEQRTRITVVITFVKPNDQ